MVFNNVLIYIKNNAINHIVNFLKGNFNYVKIYKLNLRRVIRVPFSRKFQNGGRKLYKETALEIRGIFIGDGRYKRW